VIIETAKPSGVFVHVCLCIGYMGLSARMLVCVCAHACVCVCVYVFAQQKVFYQQYHHLSYKGFKVRETDPWIEIDHIIKLTP